MSLATACLWTLARTLTLCLLAWPICCLVERWFRSVSDRWRSYSFGLLLAPCLFPELLVGYTFRTAALSSVGLAEWMCLGLLLIRIVPIGVVTLLASPSSLTTTAALHCRWLILRTNPFSISEICRWGLCFIHGPFRRVLPALGLMSVVAFQEFELSALLQTASWTDWFIAAQRFGLQKEEMLRQALWPIVIQLPLLLGVIGWTVRPHDSATDQTGELGIHRFAAGITSIYLVVAFFFGCLVPLCFMASNLSSGLAMMSRQPTQLTGLLQEIGVATSISLCAALATWSASGWFVDPRKKVSSASRIFQHVLLLPGLAGSLLLSLSAVVLFQSMWLRWLYDSPVPWLFVLTVWLLPRAVLVRLWLDTITQTEGVYLAKMLNSRSPSGSQQSESFGGRGNPPRLRPAALLFRLWDQPRLFAIGLLGYWAYLDLSTAYLLAPSAMPSGLVRLYNFMHFGRSSALSAEAFVFFGLPVIALLIGICVWGAIRRNA